MGLFFSILAVPPDDVYERRGRIQRIAGIHPRWFHHPDAIRVPEAEFSALTGAFRKAHPNFDYYGPTEYKGAQLVQLSTGLSEMAKGPNLRIILNEVDREIAGQLSLLVLGI